MTTHRTRFDSAAAALWASAFVVAALLLLLVGQRNIGNQAHAGLVSSVDDHTILTFDGGNDDLVMVLDGRGEEIFVYGIKNQTTFEFLARHRLSDVFGFGRRIGAGQKRR